MMTEEKKIENSNKSKKKVSQGKEKKRAGGVNILDVLIILCLLAVAALLFFVYSPLSLFSFRTEETDIIYSVRVYGVPSDYATNINVGDTVSDVDGYELGRIASAVEVESHTMYIFDSHGGGVKPVIHPDLVDLIITVSATADENDNGYLVDGKRIAVEGRYNLLLPGFEGEGICISLSEENANDAGGIK